MRRPTLPALSSVAATAVLVGSLAGTSAAPAAHQDHRPRNGDLVRAFSHVTASTDWQPVDKIRLGFQTFHTEGLAITPKHLFVSAVEILEPTKKYPKPVDGYDRTPGKGIGHLFVTDRQGNLQKDIVLGHGHRYHPGGIDFDGHNVWVPVAEYRPDSAATIYRVDARTLKVHRQFEVADHIGGLVKDETTGELVGNTWGSRTFYAWRPNGRQADTWQNRSFFVDYQDCQYVVAAKMLCGGVTNLPQTPTAGGTAATYELGGLGLVNLRSHRVIHEVPLQRWSTAGHVITRNPLKLTAHGDTIDLWAAPDNGDEGVGTEVLHYRADVG